MLPALVANAVACFATALALLLSKLAAPAGAAHVAFAAGIMPLILGAMLHFVPVLTRGRAPHAALHALPFAALAAGFAVAAGFLAPALFPVAVPVAAAFALATAVVMAAWIVRRGRAALGAPHPGLRWYLGAVLMLALALGAVLAMELWPARRTELRLIHLHLNTLGFIGLTALGTLAVLLPTAAQHPDARAAARLKTDLPLAATGVLAVAFGAAWAPPLAYAGAALLLVPVVRLGTAWAILFWREIGATHGAAPSLALALFGLAALLFLGAGHANARLNGTNAIFGFVLAFLLPLVTGAVSQLLPLWLRPGVQSIWHTEARALLGRYAGLRGLAFVVAGVLVALDILAGAWLAAAALALFVMQMIRVLARR